MTGPALFHLQTQETSILLDSQDESLAILYWGPSLGEISKGDWSDFRHVFTGPVAKSNFDEPLKFGFLREQSRGFLGHPTLQGHRSGRAWSTHFSITKISQDKNLITAEMADLDAELRLALTLSLSDSGILTINGELTNLGDDEYCLTQLVFWLPLPDRAQEVLDFTGRWLRERQPQRRQISYGVSSREIWEGRTGHDYTIAQIALTDGANFSSGEAWAVSLAWSGNSQHHVEKLPDGMQSIGAGELLLPGEVILKSGESYLAPVVAATYSAVGISGISDNFHRWIRSRAHHPTNVRSRPLTLNVWEAIYFDHDEAKIRAIIDCASEIGVERVVLDDGWFHDRRDDSAGLGDWVVDAAVWPNGLDSIIEYANNSGIEFGLWFEGEMVNPDSDLFRAHPEWILHEASRSPLLWRHQQVLDLSHEGAFNHVLEQVDSILSAHNISYIKWDHNRSLVDAGHLGHASVRNQTFEIYRLFAELKRRHPKLEIESCASGGGRVDLGIIEYVDRFWTSDVNDALERQSIQRWTSLVIPPEMLGTHIGPTNGHQMGRTIDISFRAINALFGHAGIEWDITQATAYEMKILKNWATFYKKNRNLLHSGRTVLVDHDDTSANMYGVVAQDKSEAIFAYMQLTSLPSTLPQMVRFPGLDQDAKYELRFASELGEPLTLQATGPLWMDGVTMSGRALGQIGARPPILAPESGVVITLSRLN